MLENTNKKFTDNQELLIIRLINKYTVPLGSERLSNGLVEYVTSEKRENYKYL